MQKKHARLVREALPTSERKPKRSTVGTKQNPTVRQFMESWLDKRKHLTERVKRQYRANLENHVLPIIGEKPIKRLTDNDIVHVIDEMEEEGLGIAAQVSATKQLNTMLNFAVKTKMIGRNPCNYVDLPTPRTKVKETDSTTIEWRTSTVQNILAELKKSDNPHHDTYSRMMLMMLGLRGSEIVGLTWDCFNLSDKTLTVRQQMKKHVGGDYYISYQTKNKHSREIPLFGAFLEAVVIEMEKGRKQVQSIKDENGQEVPNLMFVTPKGGYVTYGRHWKEWTEIQKAYFESEGNGDRYEELRWRPHYNRHICASILAKEHVPLVTAQQILGHLDPEMTERYTHSYREDVQQGTKALSAAFDQDPWDPKGFHVMSPDEALKIIDKH